MNDRVRERERVRVKKKAGVVERGREGHRVRGGVLVHMDLRGRCAVPGPAAWKAMLLIRGDDFLFNLRIKDQSIENLLDVTRAQVFLRNRAPFHLLLRFNESRRVALCVCVTCDLHP